MNDLPPPPSSSRRFRDRRGAKPAIIVLAIALVAAAAWYFWPSSATPAKAGAADQPKGKGGGPGAGPGGRGGRFGADPSRVQPVAVATARAADINIVQTGLGTVTALRTVTVKPRVDGQLKSVEFTEGQSVRAGDTLAQIDPVPFQVQLSQVEGQLARDAAQLNNARLDLERYRKLLEQDSIASQQVDAQAAQVRQLEGTVKIDQAQVDNAKLNLSYTRIAAPIAGRLGLRLVDAGNMVRGSDASGIAVITQVDPITVLFTIPQDSLPRVLTRLKSGEKPGVDAWDREQKNLLAKGTLITADNQIDVTTGTIRLKAEFPNAEAKLFPNQFVNVRMIVDTHRGAIVVPSAAIQRGAQGNVVYVVKEDSAATLRPVQVGPTEGQLTAIEQGLAAGERVITDGVDRIREGSKVEVTQPGAGARPEGAKGAKGEGQGKGSRGEGRGAREGAKGGTPEGKGAESGKREEFQKRWQGMTPEQKEEFKKRREGREASPGKSQQ